MSGVIVLNQTKPERFGSLFNADGTYPKTTATTGTNRHLADVPNYTAHPTQGAVDTAEIQTVTWTLGEAVTGVLIAAWGGTSFRGYYVTVNAPDTAQAAIRLRSNIANASVLRVFVPATPNEPTLITLNAAITRLDFVAIDNDATPDNQAEIRVG